MMNTNKTLRKVPQEKAVEILDRYQVDKELRASVNPDVSPVQLIDSWLEQEKYNEVVTFMCHSLPARESVWWGCLCLHSVALSQKLSNVQQQALEAAESWVRNPTEANRRISEARAQKAERDNAAGWLAQSAFWSGGSLTPVDAPASLAPPYLYSHAVAGAICLAAVLPDGNKAKENYRRMIAIGLDIADGGNGR
ncbi:hypothetical protein [Parendozoicomonas sp. Alg238-R29]|uniref:DUF6931 family protein n=1 Tax=Parendozoicomonas sp. Alg238-R29 TaxID=2993446 RepID=UPI00248D3F01|nr:hypothetical protein [Parendozoicomonas sp. Alg238-R29]